MSKYLTAIANKIQSFLYNTGKFTKENVKPALNKGTYDKFNKELEDYFTRQDMSEAIYKQNELANKLIALEGFLYDGLHGNLIMQLKEECDADDVECLGNNINIASVFLKSHIDQAYKILNELMGRPESEVVLPDDNARALFLIELLCSDKAIEYRTSVSEDLNELLKRYCQFIPQINPPLPESVQPLTKKQRLGVYSGVSTRYVPGDVPKLFNLAPQQELPKNIWARDEEPHGGKKAKKTYRKHKNTKGKKSKQRKTKTIKRKMSRTRRVHKK